MLKPTNFLTCVFLIWTFNPSTQIYTPDDDLTQQKPIYTQGIKTGNYHRPIIDHNYSKVYHQNQNSDFSTNFQRYRIENDQTSSHQHPIYSPIEGSSQVYVLNGTRIRKNLNPTRQIVIYNKQKRAPKVEIYKNCPRNATGQFVYEASCNQFLNCWKGRGYVQNCSPGTLFNPKTLECDFPEKVYCISGPRQTILQKERKLGQIHQIGCPKGFSGLIPNYTDCAKFINCVSGIENFMDCPPGTLFDVNKNICDFTHKATCFNGQNQKSENVNGRLDFGPIETQKSAQIKYRSNEITCPGDGLFKHPSDCSKFLNCAHGQPYVQSCGPGTLFNPELKICDFPYNVRCQNLTNEGVSIVDYDAGYYHKGSTKAYDHGTNFGETTIPYDNSEYYRPAVGQISGYSETTDRYKQTYYDRNGQSGYGQYDGQGIALPSSNGQNSNCYGQHCQSYDQNSGSLASSSNLYGQASLARPNSRSNDQNSGSLSSHSNSYDQGSLARPNSGSYDQNSGSLDSHSNSYDQGSLARPNSGSYDQHSKSLGSHSSSYGQGSLTRPNSEDFGSHFNSNSQGSLTSPNSGNLGPNSNLNGQGYLTRPNSESFGVQSNLYGQGSLSESNSGSYDQNSGSFGSHSKPYSQGSLTRPNSGFYDQNSHPYSQRGHPEPNSGSYGQNFHSYGDETVSKPNSGTLSSSHRPGILIEPNSGSYGQNSGISSSSNSHRQRRPNSGFYDQNSGSFDTSYDQTGFNHGSSINSYGQFSTSSKPYRDDGQNLKPYQTSSSSYRPNYGPKTGSYGPYDQNRHFGESNGHKIGSYGQTHQHPNGQENGGFGASSGSYGQNRYPNGQENVYRPNHGQGSGTYDSSTLRNFYSGHSTIKNPYKEPNYQEVVNINYGRTTPNPKIYDYDDTFGVGHSNKYVRATTPKILEKSWPPPFPSTDVNADYVFEYDDDEVTLEAENSVKNDEHCGKSSFHCSPDKCIPKTLVCNGVKDCQDGRDELTCLDYISRFSVEKDSKLAILEKERWNNITIATCALLCVQTRSFKCRSFNYRKIDKTCFLTDTNEQLTGALIIYQPFDYYEKIYEKVNCSEMFVCPNKKCIERTKICDGQDDCGDRMDEKGCKPEDFDYHVRLVGGKNKHEGTIEVSAFGKVGYVCDDKFGLRDADVVCKELGYHLGSVEVKGNSFYGQNGTGEKTFYMMDDVSCNGNESRLMDCDFNGWGIHNCRDQEVVGVLCKTPVDKCASDYWQCDTGHECLPLAFVCDGLLDCTDGSDEASQHCDAPTQIRLSNGTSRNQGRIEIRHHGIWGTICDDDFNEDAAKVVCRHLGYSGSATVKKDGYFGPGSGPIWLDQVFCSGNESGVEECTHWNWGEHNCEHTEDVGVICSNLYEHERHSLVPTFTIPEAYPDRCGFRKDNIFNRNDDVHFRVVKGSIARKGDYPWQAAIRVKGKSSAAHWCGAVIISEKFVLTAAHCLIGYSKGAYVIVAGDYDVDEDEGTEQEAYIEDFYLHEDFRKGHKMNNDIALIKLKGRGFRLNEDVQAICLPDKDVDYEAELNCTISGYGSIQSGKSAFSHSLRAGWVPLQKRQICTMPHVYGEAMTDGMICAGSLDEGIDSCDGDSGGPLACLYDGFFTLFGITSWGQHCGYANKPGVYVKVAHYRKWIDETFRKHSSV